MAKFHADLLKKKYGYKGETYRKLMEGIISIQTENISRKITSMTRDQLQRGLKKISTRDKQFILPDIEEVLPKRSIFIRKGAEQGKLINDTLRDKLTKNLRETMTKNHPDFIVRRGKKAGVINPNAIKEFKEAITETFAEYTKKDPKYGIPKNLEAISRTEVRATINDVKNQYTKNLLQKNPDLKCIKEWVHNKSLSLNPRMGHMRMNGKKIPFDKMFEIPIYKKENDKWIKTGRMIYMNHPHDPNAPAEEVIACQCDIKYSIRRIA